MFFFRDSGARGAGSALWGGVVALAIAGCPSDPATPPGDAAVVNGSAAGPTTSGAGDAGTTGQGTMGGPGISTGTTGTPPAMDAGGADADAALPMDATPGDATGSDAGAPQVTLNDLSEVHEAWWSYEREPTYSAVASDIRVPMRDGTELGCTLTRPGEGNAPAEGQFPGLVVEFTPYALMGSLSNTEAQFFAERGYNGLVCFVRGTLNSDGTWQHAMSSQDGRDAHDLVEWLAEQPFSNGRIGQFGESYGGQTSYGSAVEQAPHLVAVAPMQPPANLYDDVNYPGGIETKQDGPMNDWPPTLALTNLYALSAQEEYDAYHAHPTFDEFWQDRTLVGRHGDIQVPILTLGGWNDKYFREGTLVNIEAALERTWAIYGPWEHLPLVDLGQCGTCVEDPMPSGVLLAWFDHWVMELPDVPIPAEPTFVSHEMPMGASLGWRELSRWAPEGADAVTYELGSDGTLSASATATELSTFDEPGEPSEPGSALSFTTEPLEEDRVLLGRATLQLRISLSAPDANFYVELLDVDDQGGETLVDQGFLKASHRDSHVTPEPAPVGEPVDYSLHVRPQHYRFAAGHRVRLRLSGGPDDTLVQPPPVEVTLETGTASTLRLPGFAAAY